MAILRIISNDMSIWQLRSASGLCSYVAAASCGAWVDILLCW